MIIGVTGSAGFIGQNLYSHLRSLGHQVIGFDLSTPICQGGPGITGASVSEKGMPFVDVTCDLSVAVPETAIQECDVVIHLAANGNPSAGWGCVLDSNIIATRNVFAACANEPNCKRVIFASSNHVSHGSNCEVSTTSKLLPGTMSPSASMVDTETIPDSLYAVSKVFGEALGVFHSREKSFEFIAIRLGWCLYEDPSTQKGQQHDAYLRSMWLSLSDCLGYFQAAVNLPFNEGNCIVVNAVSNNTRKTMDISHVPRLLGGFFPKDDSESFFHVK